MHGVVGDDYGGENSTSPQYYSNRLDTQCFWCFLTVLEIIVLFSLNLLHVGVLTYY